MRLNTLLASTAISILVGVSVAPAQIDSSQPNRKKSDDPTVQVPSKSVPDASRAQPAAADKKTGLDRADQTAGEKGLQGRAKAREAQSDSKSMNNRPTPPATSGQAKTDDKTNASKSDQTTSEQSKRSTTPSSAQAPSTAPGVGTAAAPSKAGTSAAGDAKTTQTNATASISADQQTRLNAAFSQVNVRPVTNVNFSVSVGVSVPPRVTLQPLPSAILTIVPQYRGHRYFVVEDRIIIVEPRTRRIVTIIDRRGGSTVGMRTPERSRFTQAQMTSIRERTLKSGNRAPTSARAEFVVGQPLPQTYVIEEFPVDLYTEIPDLRPYRYVIVNDEIILVDPTERRIVEVIQ